MLATLRKWLTKPVQLAERAQRGADADRVQLGPAGERVRVTLPRIATDTLQYTGRRFLRDLTPDRIIGIFDGAAQYIRDQMMLAEQMEESDDHLRGTLALRRAAVLGLDVIVTPGNPDDPRSVAAAALIEQAIARPWFRRCCDYLLRAILQQHAAVEILYRAAKTASVVLPTPPGAPPQVWWPEKIRTVEPDRWHFDRTGAPYLFATPTLNPGDLFAPPAGRFALHSVDETSVPGTFALVRAVAKLWLLGNLNLANWGTTIDQFGVPQIEFQYAEGLGSAEVSRMVNELLALAGRRVIAHKAGTTVTLHDVPDQTPHKDFEDMRRRAMSRLLLGQDSSQMALEGQKTGATLQGNVRDDIRDGDATLLDASLNQSWAGPWTVWHFGPDVAAPRITHVPPENDLTAADVTMVSDLLIKVREGKISPEAAIELLEAAGVPRARVEAMVEATPLADDRASDLAFKREVFKLFLADGTVSDVLYNATDILALLAQVNVAAEPEYQPPWIPVVAQPGPIVTGDPLTDAEGDVVGSSVDAAAGGGLPGGFPPPAAGAATGGSGAAGARSAAAGAGASDGSVDKAAVELKDTGGEVQLRPTDADAAGRAYAAYLQPHRAALQALAKQVDAAGGSDAEKFARFQARLPELFTVAGLNVEQRAEFLSAATLATYGGGAAELAEQAARQRGNTKRGRGPSKG